VRKPSAAIHPRGGKLGYSGANRRSEVPPMLRLAAAALLLIAVSGPGAFAQESAITPAGPQAPGDSMQAPQGRTDEDVNARIEQLLGDPAQFQAAFDAVTAAVADDDPQEVARWVAYPMTLSYNDEELTIEDANDFVDNYEDLVTEDVYDAVRDQNYADLFVNSDGVMFGDGQMWMTYVCRDETCSKSDVRIISIHSALR
jgi:hypothetical protein